MRASGGSSQGVELVRALNGWLLVYYTRHVYYAMPRCLGPLTVTPRHKCTVNGDDDAPLYT